MFAFTDGCSWFGPALLVFAIWWSLNWRKFLNKDNGGKAARTAVRWWLGRK